MVGTPYHPWMGQWVPGQPIDTGGSQLCGDGLDGGTTHSQPPVSANIIIMKPKIDCRLPGNYYYVLVARQVEHRSDKVKNLCEHHYRT